MNQASYWWSIFFLLFKENRKFYALAALNIIVQLALFACFCLVAIAHWPAITSNAIRDTLFAGRVVLLLLMYYIIMFTLQRFFRWMVISITQNFFRTQKMEFKKGFINALNQIDQVISWSMLEGCLGKIIDFMQRSRVIHILVNIVVPGEWRQYKVLTEAVIVAEKLGVIKAMQRSRELVQQAWGSNPTIKRPITALNNATLIMALVPLGSGILTYTSQGIMWGTLISLGILTGLALIDDWLQAFVAIVAYRFAIMFNDELMEEYPEIALLYGSQKEETEEETEEGLQASSNLEEEVPQPADSVQVNEPATSEDSDKKE